MKIFVIGNGGREHAICWKVRNDMPDVNLFCAPFNAGIREIATCVEIDVLDFESLIKFAKEEEIDLTIVSPDNPLVLGLVDEFENNGLRVFGPNKLAAEIEGSKIFAKNFMKRNNIPTASYKIFDDFDLAMSYIYELEKFPIVIKANGLAYGKGVEIVYDRETSVRVISEMMCEEKFGESGRKIVIEEFLEGRELSILAFTDGTTVVPMVSAKDYKRAFDYDKGPNTGGMGSYSPNEVYTEKIEKVCMSEIFIPTISALKREGRKFKGVLYFGLIETVDGVKVIEYNARFGDPETQSILPRLKTNLVDILNSIIDERLDEILIEWNDVCSCVVVLASQGYPSSYSTGHQISLPSDALIFHAGTKMVNDVLVSSGGRVLNSVGIGRTLSEARRRAYETADKICFENKYFRKDIAE